MKNEINALIMQAMKEHDVELPQERIDSLSKFIEDLLTITCIEAKEVKQECTINVDDIPSKEESIKQLKKIINEREY